MTPRWLNLFLLGVAVGVLAYATRWGNAVRLVFVASVIVALVAVVVAIRGSEPDGPRRYEKGWRE